MKNKRSPIIRCTVEVGSKVISQDFDRSTSIREVKRALKKKYEEMGTKTHKTDREIIFYCDGKQIENENEQIGNIVDGNEVNLAMLSLSLNDSSLKNKSEIQKKAINKLSLNCKEHSGNKELLICIDCGIAICDQCVNKHEGHQRLYKTELINHGKELTKKSEDINNVFIECGFSDSKDNNLLCEEEKQRINININNMQKMVDEIKKTSKNLNNSFNKTYDDVYPYIMNYKEKIRKLNERSSQLKTMKNEKDFIEYYYDYKEIKQKETNILDYLSKVKTLVKSYKEILNEFYVGTNKILEKVKEDYNMLINLSFYRVKVDTTFGSITSKPLGGGSGKMNLRSILDPNARRDLLEKEKKVFIEKKSIKGRQKYQK